MKKVLTVCMLLAAFAFSAIALTSQINQGPSNQPVVKKVAPQPTPTLMTKSHMESDMASIARLKADGSFNVNNPAYQRLLAQAQADFNAARHEGNRGLDDGHDACPATHIGSLNFTDVGTNVGKASDFPGGCVGDNEDVIYEFTAATGGPVTVSLCGSDYDTQLRVTTDGACPGATPVDCNDDYYDGVGYPCGVNSQLSFASVAGQQYFIIISGYFGSTGNYVLNVYSDSGCVADGALSAPGLWVGNTCGAGNNCSLLPSEDLIIAVNIPSAGSWRFSLCDETIPFWDSYFFLGTGCCVGDVGAQDDGCGPVNYYLSNPGCFDLEQRTYYVTVEAYSEFGCGDVRLLVEPCTPPSGRCCYVPAGGDPYHPVCEDLSVGRCEELGGAWNPDLNCLDHPCDVYGSCCYDNGFNCVNFVTRGNCDGLGGVWHEGVDCSPDNCIPPPCHPDFVQNAPFSLPGNTTGAGDDCGLRAGDDQIWEINIPYASRWTFTLCGSDAAFWDAVIYLGTTCCSGDISANDDNFCGADFSVASTIECIALGAGTVYLDVEGYCCGGAGDYVLTVTDCDADRFGRCCYRDAVGSHCTVNLANECHALGGIWLEGGNCVDNPCPEIGDCGPIDLVFAIDNTGSMGGAIANVIAELPNIVAVANIASGGDLRMGLLTFPEDRAHTIEELTFNQAQVLASIAGVTLGGGANIPEASDETLREIITQDGCTDGTEFTTGFRGGALKIIVLVTDALPGGCDDNYTPGVDDVAAHQRAVDAATQGIRIASVDVGGASATILQDYQLTTAGTYTLVPGDGSGTGAAITAMLAECAQGALQLDIVALPDLICEGGYIEPNPALVRIRVTNTGDADCNNVVIDLDDGAGAGGTWVTITPAQNLGTIPPAGFVEVDFAIVIANNPAGGQICAPAIVSCVDCPGNFIGVCVTVPPCEPGCIPEHAYFDAALPLPQSQCLQLCPENDSWIYVSNVPIGFYPVVSIAQGCDFRTHCDRECQPATYTEQVINWFINDDGVWCLVIRGDGCVCITLERILSVELNSFTAVAASSRVDVAWATSSETNNDHFEVYRDGQLVANVAGLGNSSSGHSYRWADNNVVNGRTYAYSLISVSAAGAREDHGTINATPTFNAGPVTEYTLLQNYPNPFNPATEIAFNLVESGLVNLKVYDLLGREVATLVNGNMEAGAHTITFNAANLTSGVYLYRIDVNGFSAEKKMLFLK